MTSFHALDKANKGRAAVRGNVNETKTQRRRERQERERKSRSIYSRSPSDGSLFVFVAAFPALLSLLHNTRITALLVLDAWIDENNNNSNDRVFCAETNEKSCSLTRESSVAAHPVCAPLPARPQSSTT